MVIAQQNNWNRRKKIEKLKREQKLKQYRKQIVKTEKTLTRQQEERIRRKEKAI